MTSRERVLSAARHEEPDRVPLMLWIEQHALVKMAVGSRPPKSPAHRAFFRGLQRLSETLPTEELRNGAPLLAYLAQTEYLLDLGVDMVELIFGFPPLMMKKFRLEEGKPIVTDIYNIERGIGGIYLESVGYPCKTPEELERYRFPNMSSPLHYAHIRVHRRLRPDTALLAWCPGVQDWSQSIMGMENLYMWLAQYPEVMERYFRRMTQHTLQIIRGGIRAGADGIMIADDYGTQQSTMMSKKMWHRFIYPCLRRQCEEAHRLGGVAMLHSCGHVMPLLDLMADAGVDMLHPLQPSAGNSLTEAKERFGDRLCFVTGIDVQRLPTITPREVRDGMLESVRVGARDGGFVLCPTNFIQHDTPLENIDAMFNTIDEIRNGRF